ncbi:MAG: YdcF family protein [Pseudomonadota bacterium]
MIARCLIAAVGLGILLYFATLIAVIASSWSMRDQHLLGRSISAPVDAAIVLAGGTDPDGVLSYSTRRRVWTGVQLLKSGKARALIMSGGMGPKDRGVPQGERMVRLAESYGAEPSALIAEPAAISTFQNLILSFDLADERGFNSLALVTDAYHLRRAAALATFFGRSDVDLVAAPGLEYDHWTRRITSMTRETLAWWFNLLKAAGWEGLALLGYTPQERADRIR